MTPTPQLSVGLLLTAAAGFADTIGFIELGGSYTSFMSGNTTQLGNALASGTLPVALHTASLIGLFFLGGLIGSLLAQFAGRRWGAAATTAFVLLSFGATLLLASLGYPPTQFMLSLAAAAGAQNAILPSTGSVRLGATFVTGTLFNAADDLARALRGNAPPWRWAQHLLVWGSLLFGALLGGLVYAQLGLNALLVPALLYCGFLIAFLLSRPANVIV